MKEAVPCYYHKFRCIAKKCTHSCCVGWEIDIDEDTMKLYSSCSFPMHNEIMQNTEGNPPHFILKDKDRCPFLKDDGLCEIILRCGHDALCDICYMHPRFTNTYDSFSETGLGLCCEEAARIVLSEKDVFSVDFEEDVDLTDKEILFLSKRDAVFSVLQNRAESIYNRFSALAKMYGFEFDFSFDKIHKAYKSLERLDASWTDELNRLDNFKFDKSIFRNKDFDVFFEQLAVYFVFRHLADAFYDEDYTSKLRFALAGCYIIGAIIQCDFEAFGKVSFERAADVARMYSSEIEYSEVNTEKLMEEGAF